MTLSVEISKEISIKTTRTARGGQSFSDKTPFAIIDKGYQPLSNRKEFLNVERR